MTSGRAGIAAIERETVWWRRFSCAGRAGSVAANGLEILVAGGGVRRGGGRGPALHLPPTSTKPRRSRSARPAATPDALGPVCQTAGDPGISGAPDEREVAPHRTARAGTGDQSRLFSNAEQRAPSGDPPPARRVGPVQRLRDWLYRYAWNEDPTPEAASPALRKADEIERDLMRARRWMHHERRFTEWQSPPELLFPRGTDEDRR